MHFRLAEDLSNAFGHRWYVLIKLRKDEKIKPNELLEFAGQNISYEYRNEITRKTWLGKALDALHIVVQRFDVPETLLVLIWNRPGVEQPLLHLQHKLTDDLSCNISQAQITSYNESQTVEAS
jgi:hypothetical protein